MHEQRHTEINRRPVDRLELRVVQIDAAHVGSDMAADKAVIPHAAPQFLRGRDRVLHRQQRPAAETFAVRCDRRREAIIEHPRGFHRDLGIEMIIE